MPQRPPFATTARRLALCSACAALLAGCGSAPPPAQPVARGDYTAVTQQLEGFIAQQMKAHKVTGLSIALVDDQKTLWAHGAGWADAAAQRPAGPDTLYRMGSISKLFTDTAAMQLVAQQRLDLDAPIQQALPDFRMRSRWGEAPITPRQLMSHHAGLPRDVLAGMWATPVGDFRAMVAGLAQAQADAPPGLVLAYSNVGLTVLGTAIERLAGVPFEAHMQRALLAPLGMSGATFAAAAPDAPQMARTYFKGEPRTDPALRDVPAGGLTASVADMARFLAMQFAHGRNAQGEVVLPEAQWAEMLRVQNADVPLDVGFGIGLGWMLATLGNDSVHGGGPVAHHGGATYYFRSQLIMLPEQKLGVIVAANDGAAGPLVNQVAQRALALLLEARTGQRQPPRVPGYRPSAQPWSTAARQACVGDYLTPGGLVSVSLDDGKLHAVIDGKSIDLLEGEDRMLGLRYRLAGLIPLPLGALADLGVACRRIAGRDVLVARLDEQEMLVGERLPPAATPLPPAFAALAGRWRPVLAPGEVAPVESVTVLAEGQRLFVQPQLIDAFGGTSASARLPLQLLSDTEALLPSLLAGTGPAVVRVPAAEGDAFVYSGWTFRRERP